MTTLHEAFQSSEEALRAGDLSRAKSIFEQILQTIPDEPHAINGLGVVAFRSGRLTEADDYHRRAIELRADNPTFHGNLCLVYYQQGRLAEAMACILPNLETFNVVHEVGLGQTIAVGDIAWSLLYAVTYCSAMMLLAVLLFRRREVF